MSCNLELEEELEIENTDLSPLINSPSTSNQSLNTIETKLNLKHPLNRKLPWLSHPDYKVALKLCTQDKRRFAKKLARLKWGREQQALAEKAKLSDNINDLKNDVRLPNLNHPFRMLISFQLDALITPEGVKKANSYLKVAHKVFKG
jgi:hypothetical protein